MITEEYGMTHFTHEEYKKILLVIGAVQDAEYAGKLYPKYYEEGSGKRYRQHFDNGYISACANIRDAIMRRMEGDETEEGKA